jgi:hypothetical protein
MVLILLCIHHCWFLSSTYQTGTKPSSSSSTNTHQGWPITTYQQLSVLLAFVLLVFQVSWCCSNKVACSCKLASSLRRVKRFLTASSAL